MTIDSKKTLDKSTNEMFIKNRDQTNERQKKRSENETLRRARSMQNNDSVAIYIHIYSVFARSIEYDHGTC